MVTGLITLNHVCVTVVNSRESDNDSQDVRPHSDHHQVMGRVPQYYDVDKYDVYKLVIAFVLPY